VITAPFNGIVVVKNVDSGDWVQQGKHLVTLGSCDDLFVRVPVGERLVRFISPGEEVPVTINAFERQLTGTVEDLEPVADAKTKNIFVKVRIPSQAMVAENMSATVFLPTSKRQTLAIIPRDALIKFQGKDFVYTIKDGKASILPVNIVSYLAKTVAADNPYLAPGMPVVVEGNERLRPDQPVTVAGAN
jgi:RND family efflux transporter MFP subunit